MPPPLGEIAQTQHLGNCPLKLAICGVFSAFSGLRGQVPQFFNSLFTPKSRCLPQRQVIVGPSSHGAGVPEIFPPEKINGGQEVSVATMIVTSVEMPSVFQTAGVAGFILYIIGFASLQFGFLDGNGNFYAFISVAAASLVLISLTEMFNLASALIQLSWIMIGLTGIAFRTLRKRRKAVPAAIPISVAKTPIPRQSTLFLRPNTQIAACAGETTPCSGCINFTQHSQNSFESAAP